MFDQILIDLVVKTLGIFTDPLVSLISQAISPVIAGGYRVTVDTQGMSVTQHLLTQREELDQSRERV